MKTRLSALAVAISSVSILTACGGGGSDVSGLAPEPAAVPTVTVTAPATAITDTAFSVTWASTGALSCSSSDLTGVDQPSGSVSQTETAVATKTYSVTCTGAGGSATGTSAPVDVTAAPTVAGLWQGTSSVGGRAISGVVTKEGDYWLAYAVGNNGAIVGFYTGTGTPAVTSSTGGTYASTDLRDINFAGGFSGGNAAAGTLDSGIFTSKTSFSGVLAPVSGGAVTGANYNIGAITTHGVTGTFTDEVGHNITSVTLNGSTLIMNMDITISVLPAFGTDVATVTTTDTFNGTFANGVFTPTSGSSTVLGCTGSSTICTAQVTNSVQNWGQVGGSVNLAQPSSTLTNRRNGGAGGARNTTYTLSSPSLILSSLPAITAGTFNLPTYNPAYETAPTLATLAGSYTGSAGVGVATTSATFVVGSSGAITGAAASSGCSYTGNAVTHPTGGNVYDVTLTVSGGSCTSAGAFAGVATYDATSHQVVVTTMNAARDKGLMFVGTKP